MAYSMGWPASSQLQPTNSGDPIADLKFGKSNQRALDEATGEFNAYDKKDLIQSITSLMNAVASGQVVEANASAEMSDTEVKDARRELLASALNDESGTQWAALGAGLARQINEQTDREGFLRRVAQGQTLRQGEVPRVPMPAHDTIAVVATGASNVGYQTIRQRVFTPDE